MSQRYFCEAKVVAPQATLAGPEAHHLAHVMRAKPGDEVVLFDGAGGEYLARVERIDRSAVQLAVLSHQEIDREMRGELVIGAALPKGDRQRWLIEKLTELGVHSFVPLATAREVAQPSGGALERLRRGVIEASKQCGRNRLMQVQPACPWREFLAQPPANVGRFVAHPGGVLRLDELVREGAAQPRIARYWLAVGPEGGLTDDEVRQATAAGWQTVDLGERILRVETAAVALATAAALSLAAAHATGMVD